jgi:multisubunit Na+/H+ antiporter MnhE subunit
MFLFRRHPSWFIVTSNVFLLFPLFVAFFKKEWVYFGITLGIFVASIGFHYGYEFHRKNPLTQKFRILDWLLAMLGTLYVFYFITQSDARMSMKVLFAALFMITLTFFWYSYILKNYEGYKKLHPWFHVFSPIVLGFIVLFL